MGNTKTRFTLDQLTALTVYIDEQNPRHSQTIPLDKLTYFEEKCALPLITKLLESYVSTHQPEDYHFDAINGWLTWIKDNPLLIRQVAGAKGKHQSQQDLVALIAEAFEQLLETDPDDNDSNEVNTLKDWLSKNDQRIIN